MTKQPLPGQRWVSDSEPELGLGIILEAGFGRVEVLFPAASERRQYALKSAPLRRVEFKEGDRIKLHDGRALVVESVEERKGMLVYRSGGAEITEAELSDKISFSKPEERLLGGQVDELADFDLRVEALERRCAARKSAVRGFVGGRVSLIPHQMFIAGEVTSRLAPRVLLADEVGLGKTIEAGLILHRLHLTGRAERVLILVPEPLIHQWFVELLRRFNLLFSIFDEERCAAIEKLDAEENPFLDSQLVICSVGLLAQDERRAAQVLAAGWDLLVVDEAHHLEWSAAQPSAQYQLVAALAAATPGLLLLTATPQQLGVEGHFARLRLLDPDRYADLREFLAEAEHYEEVARAVDRLLAGKPLTKKESDLFAAKSPRIRARCDALDAGDAGARELLVADLLDAFGTGRVMFRNTRAALSGFPQRQARLVPLVDGVAPRAMPKPTRVSATPEEVRPSAQESHGARSDAIHPPLDSRGVDANEVKVKWVVELLKELGEEKVLLICKTRALAEQVSAGLQRLLNVKCAVFHEGLTLLQRDRNAAYFSEADGARILVCSEIGSEGRNFQFAHHLVLFDLPENPELVEQRIGRLDRIGQTDLIKIHVPFLPGTAGEVLARWYHEGLDAFEHNLHGAAEIVRMLGAELARLLEKPDARQLAAFLKTTKECRAGVVKKLERGHDRLLELNSCRVERAAAIIDGIRTLDSDAALEPFALRLFEQLGIHIEDLAPRTYLFRPDALTTDALPSLSTEGQSMTFDRTRALSREDLGFLTWDHPLIRGALDGLLGTEAGNSAFAVWRDGGRETILLEACFIAECAAPTALHVDRFLPMTPIRVVVDHALADLSADAELTAAHLEKGDVFRLLDRGAVKKKLLPSMLEKTRDLAAEKLAALVGRATGEMTAQFSHELRRLRDLAEINDHVRPAEIAATAQQQTDLAAALAGAHLRLDAVRLILRMP